MALAARAAARRAGLPPPPWLVAELAERVDGGEIEDDLPDQRLATHAPLSGHGFFTSTVNRPVSPWPAIRTDSVRVPQTV